MLSSLVSVESAAEQDFLANLLSNNPSKTCVIVIDVIVVVEIVLCYVSMCKIVVSFIIKVNHLLIA